MRIPIQAWPPTGPTALAAGPRSGEPARPRPVGRPDGHHRPGPGPERGILPGRLHADAARPLSAAQQRLPRHYQRQQWLRGRSRLRPGHRPRQPRGQQTGARPDRFRQTSRPYQHRRDARPYRHRRRQLVSVLSHGLRSVWPPHGFSADLHLVPRQRRSEYQQHRSVHRTQYRRRRGHRPGHGHREQRHLQRLKPS